MLLEANAVETTLLAWEAVLCNGKTVVTGDVVDIWTAILQDEAVTEEEFRRAAVVVVKASRYGLPKPVDVIDAVRAIRKEDRDASRPRLRMARDAEGRELPRPVPVDQVDEHGRWAAPGAPCPPAPPKALRTAVEGPLTPEDVRLKIRGMSPIARRAFVGMIRFDGGDASAEIEAIRAVEADRKDAAQAALVREQAAAMRVARNTPIETRPLARSGGHG